MAPLLGTRTLSLTELKEVVPAPAVQPSASSPVTCVRPNPGKALCGDRDTRVPEREMVWLRQSGQMACGLVSPDYRQAERQKTGPRR